jgi:gamma-glutamyltranspeptidase/glutathione hydrolase
MEGRMNFLQDFRQLWVAVVLWTCSFSFQAFGQSVNPTDLTRLPSEPLANNSKKGWATQGFAVASANPLATQAGYEVLKSGGAAIDAAVAIQLEAVLLSFITMGSASRLTTVVKPRQRLRMKIFF